MNATLTETSSRHAILAEGLRKNFRLNTVLAGVELALAPGEIVALTGPNGAGKTTLLKILATLIRPSRGRALVNGHDVVRDVALARASVGLLSHGSYVYDDLTAMENLRFWATLSNADAEARVLRSALQRVELDSGSGERVRTFSLGMKRRLALARLFLSSPQILLLDEPFAGLDQSGRKWLEEFLREFKARGGSALMTTHSFATGIGVADRVAILAGGRIALDRPSATMTSEEFHRLYAFHTENGG